MYGFSPADSRKMNAKTLYITELALITTIMIIMAFTPLGYFRTPFLSITLMAAPTAIGAILLGPLAGAYCGAVFGVTSIINAITGGGLTGMLLLIDPLGAVFTLLIPRILDGYLTALIAYGFKKLKRQRMGVFLASLCCPVLNTLLFTGSLILIFFQTDYVQGLASSFGATDPLMFVAAFIGVQGLAEAVVCFIVASLISLTLLHWKNRQ